MKVEVARVYDTLLSSPGMHELVRIDLKISRKTVLMFSQILEAGMQQTTEQEGLLKAAGAESLAALQELINTCLERSALQELHQKLKDLTH